jgi:hypothetical protein
MVAAQAYHGLFIEMKRKPNKLTKNQEDWMRRLYLAGYCVRVAWSGEEAIELVKEYFHTNTAEKKALCIRGRNLKKSTRGRKSKYDK